MRDLTGILELGRCEQPGCEGDGHQGQTVSLSSGRRVCSECVGQAAKSMCEICGAHPPLDAKAISPDYNGPDFDICGGCALAVNGHSLGGTIAGWVQRVGAL